MSSKTSKQPSGQTISDAFGRFHVNLPQGAVPMCATYNFGVPSAMLRVNIMAVDQDQMFQQPFSSSPSCSAHPNDENVY